MSEDEAMASATTGKRKLSDLAPSAADVAAAKKAKKKLKRSQAKLKQKQRGRGHLKEDSVTVSIQPADQQVRPSSSRSCRRCHCCGCYCCCYRRRRRRRCRRVPAAQLPAARPPLP